MTTPNLFNQTVSKMSNHTMLGLTGVKANVQYYETQIKELSEKISELKMKLAVEKTILKNKQEKQS